MKFYSIVSLLLLGAVGKPNLTFAQSNQIVFKLNPFSFSTYKQRTIPDSTSSTNGNNLEYSTFGIGIVHTSFTNTEKTIGIGMGLGSSKAINNSKLSSGVSNSQLYKHNKSIYVFSGLAKRIDLNKKFYTSFGLSSLLSFALQNKWEWYIQNYYTDYPINNENIYYYVVSPKLFSANIYMFQSLNYVINNRWAMGGEIGWGLNMSYIHGIYSKTQINNSYNQGITQKSNYAEQQNTLALSVPLYYNISIRYKWHKK